MAQRASDNTDHDDSREGSTAEDTSYSPGIEREAESLQQDQSTHATDVDLDQVKLLPGTGGDPDDQGDIRVPEEDIHLPRDPDRAH